MPDIYFVPYACFMSDIFCVLCMFYVRLIFCVLCMFCVVTGDPGSKPDQKYARRRDRHNYIRNNRVQLGLGAKEFRFFLQYIGTMCGR